MTSPKPKMTVADILHSHSAIDLDEAKSALLQLVLEAVPNKADTKKGKELGYPVVYAIGANDQRVLTIEALKKRFA